MTTTAPAPVVPEAARITGAVRARVDAVLGEFLTTKTQEAPDESLPPVVAAIRDFVAGGKRLRPVFAHCGWLAAGGDPDAEAIARVGGALELFHCFTLIHDDVMDGSDTRRGGPAMHVRLAAVHRADEETTDLADPAAIARFATNAAILVGDLCLVWSDELLHTAGLPPSVLAGARPLLDLMRTEVMAGQYLDLERTEEHDWLPRAWRTIALKTAGYTVERPLQLGAALAGGGPGLLQTCTAYGRPLGEAFQLRDDLLGVFGDPARTGKPVGEDLHAGKPTQLLAYAAANLPPEHRYLIDQAGSRRYSDDELDELVDQLAACGARDLVECRIVGQVRAACLALERAAVPAQVRGALGALAVAATDRGD
jgi:geranylgeranyl diphosphate synthase, type I